MNANSCFFDAPSEPALVFYRAHGYVCFSGVLSAKPQESVRSAWSEMVTRYSSEIGVKRESYLSEISQWRDLWKDHAVFQSLLSETLARYAEWGFELGGARLLHDHIIRKSSQGSNGTIPWHQDSMYWPVDRTGCSTWWALNDTSCDQGCLEVVAGSHLDVSSPPVDFMASDISFDEERITALPVRAGDVVLLHSKTWHRSRPLVGGERLAHLALWVPPETRYSPEKARWHPLNEQVTVAPGALLNQDEFPVFGTFEQGNGSSVPNDHAGVEQPSGMFNARSRVEAFVQSETGANSSLGQILSDLSVRERLAKAGSELVDGSDHEACLRLVERVWVSAAAFEMHRSRNVFNSAYADWAKKYDL